MVTSEDVRAYEPRNELFHQGLERIGCDADQVLHVGDSLSNDAPGTNAAGIRVAWINRRRQVLPANLTADYDVPTLQHVTTVLADVVRK